MRIASFCVRGVAALAFMALGALAQAHAGEAAESAKEFVQREANRGVAILSDTSLSAEARRGAFRSFILGLVDQRRIAQFALGQYRAKASSADFEAFVKAFEDYGVAIYESRLSRYKGQMLIVSGVVERSPEDIVVTTEVSGPGGAQSSGEPLRVAFRLARTNGAFKAVDIQVAGIWLAIDQRSQFTAFLSKHNGDLKVLTTDLKARTADVLTGLAQN